MTEFCIKIYRFFRNHRAVFWVSMIALYAFFGYFASKIYLEEDINKLMPSSKMRMVLPNSPLPTCASRIKHSCSLKERMEPLWNI